MNDDGATVEWIGKGNQSTWRKPTPEPFCPQVSLALSGGLNPGCLSDRLPSNWLGHGFLLNGVTEWIEQLFQCGLCNIKSKIEWVATNWKVWPRLKENNFTLCRMPLDPLWKWVLEIKWPIISLPITYYCYDQGGRKFLLLFSWHVKLDYCISITTLACGSLMVKGIAECVFWDFTYSNQLLPLPDIWKSRTFQGHSQQIVAFTPLKELLWKWTILQKTFLSLHFTIWEITLCTKPAD